MIGRRGQGLMEFAILFGVVIAALTIMNSYLKRSIQQGVKTAADRMSPYANDDDGEQAQLAGMRQESGDRPNKKPTTPGPRVQEQAVASASQRQQAAVAHGDGSMTRRLPLDSAGKPANWQKNAGALSKHGPDVSAYSEVVLNQ